MNTPRYLRFARAFLVSLALWSGLGTITALHAQTPAAQVAAAGASPSGLWRDADETALLAARGGLSAADARRGAIPASYRTLHLDRALLAAKLAAAPHEFSAIVRSANPPAALEIELPIPNSKRYARFAVEESPIMEAGLAARYPEIRTYSARGIDNPALVARLDVTPQGFHGLILAPGGEIYLDPYFADGADQETVIAYYRRDYLADKPFQCLTPGTALPPSKEMLARAETSLQRPTGASLRTYRLALAATGEYTAAVGGTVAKALAAMVTTMNRVDGVYEREFAIRMVLINNTDQLIYTDGNTDPYTNSDGGTMLGENQNNIDNIIHDANYDIGHVFSTGGGGIAGLGVVCTTGRKAMGVTGSPTPTGDGYDIDYVAHEMGHQFGATHTFNATTGSCGGGNRTASTAYEPGSGVTIMAYAGICSDASVQDLAPHSIEYFHSISYDQIDAYTTAGNGKNAFSTVATGNTPPVITTPTAYTIPISTPFALTGSATDIDGDTLTYCWEELDRGDVVNATSVDAQDNGASPLFRSYPPTTSPTRYFPSLTYILNNANVPPLLYGINGENYLVGEALPTKARPNGLNFRCTVRDNHASGGGSNYTAVKLTVADGAGPFIVTAPNAAASFAGGSPLTVSWNVANTAAAPVSCANVSISLSTDGGQTFPFVLASSVPNTGSATVTLPGAANVATARGRIKVQAVGNIFFDIDNADLTITADTSAPTFTRNGNSLTLVRGTTAATAATVGTAAAGSNGSAVTGVSISNVPDGVTVAASLVNGSVVLTGTADCLTAVTSTTRTFSVTVTVTDAAGATATGAVNVVVQPDPAPTVGVYAATTLVAGETAAVTPSAGAADANFNLSANPFAVSPGTLPGGGTITIDQLTGTVTVASTAASTPGTTVVGVTCQDDCGAVSTKSFNVKVTSATAGNPPAVTGTLAADATVGSAFSYQVTATNTPTTFSANGLPSGLSIDAATGLISGTPLQAGVFSVDLRAANVDGAGTAILALTIMIPPPPLPPAPVISSAVAGTAQAGTAYSYQITATNAPSAFGATGLPPGLNFDAGAGVISGTPTQAGAYVITLSAANAGGAGTAALTLTVTPAAPVTPVPVITSVLTADGQQDQAFSYQITADNSPASYGATGLPPGLTVDAATGLISGVPTVSGNYAVTVSATNAAGTSTASLILSVTARPLPVVTIAATAKNAAVGGAPGLFTLRRTGDLSAPLDVFFLVKGNGRKGVDYQLLPTHKKIKAGKAERNIRINARGDLGGLDKRTVKLILAPNDAYTVDAVRAAKVKILAGQE